MMWDLTRDEFSPINKDHVIVEVANLYLDEPKLESIIFVNEGNEVNP